MKEDPVQLEYAGRGRLHREIRVPANAPLSVRVTLGATFFLIWRMALAAVLGLLLATIWSVVAPIVAVLTGIAIFIGLPAVAGMLGQMREKRAMVILSYLEQATRLNLPLARMLDAAQQSETSRTAKRLRRVRILLEDGAPLGLALPVAVPELSERRVRLIAAGERLGNLRQTLTDLLRDPREGEEESAWRDSFGRWYPVLLALVFSFVLMLVLIFVMPKIEDIAGDFRVRLPYAARTLGRLRRELVDLDWLPLAVILAVAVSALGGPFRRILSARTAATLGIFDRIYWYLPVAHGLARDRGLADACNTMATALRAGYPLPRAIQEAAELRMNRVLRERLNEWRKAVEGGMAADQAARAARLPALVCGMIGSGRGGDPGAAMEFLASYYEARFSRARELLHAAIIPVLALGFGGVVLFMASGLYLPLLQMMDQLSENAMKVTK